ncbi:MAG: hypothetical protein KC656_31060, partial [Myxococcales bacterium]|nr:hypothetical protein [Myxococcales bacterium]
EIRVTPAAPVGGEAWREREGWTVSVAPVTSRRDLQHQLCRVYALEHAPLVMAPDDLFVEEGRSRIEVFADACAQGPTDRAYVDAEVAACGAPPLTREQAFLEDRVFTAIPVPTAPPLPLEAEVTSRPTLEPEQLDRLVDLDRPGRFSLVRDGWDGPWSLVHDDLTSRPRRMPLDLPGHRWSASIAWREQEVVVLLGSAWSGGPDTLVHIDRTTGAIATQALQWPDVDVYEGAAMAMAGDRLVVGRYPELPGPGSLALVRPDTAEVRKLDLPPPPDGHELAVEALWTDPDDPDAVFAHVSVQDYWQDYDVSSLTVHEDRVYRVYVDGPGYELLWSSSAWDLRTPRIRPRGPVDGRFLFTVTAGDRALVGALDLRDGAWSVSHDACLRDAWSPFVHEGALVDRLFGPATEAVRRWRP